MKSDLAQAEATETDQSFLSVPRREYVRQYSTWHENLKTGHARPVVRFPLLRRPFPAPALLLPEREQRESFVTASMASIPSRESLLEKTVASILPQVDVLNLYLNGYSSTPQFLSDEKIHVVHSREYGDLGDNGKFFFLDSVLYGYHFTIDDDIIYPPDYVQQMILKIEQYDRKAVVGCHGVIFAQPFVRFLQGRKVFHFKRKLDGDTPVNLLGTGTVAYHTSTIELTFGEFKQPGMADVWLALAAKRQHVPMIAIQRQDAWLVPLVEGDESSLYEAARKDDELQTLLIGQEMPWAVPDMGDLFPVIDSHLATYPHDDLAARAIGLAALPRLSEALQLDLPETCASR